MFENRAVSLSGRHVFEHEPSAQPESFFENGAPISGGNAISGKTENRKKFQSLRRFLKMVFPPVMGTLFPTNTGNGTTC